MKLVKSGWRFLLSMLVLLTSAGRMIASDSLSGTYVGDKLTVQLEAAADAYRGSITLDGKAYPLKAASSARGLEGSFTSDGEAFDFVATIDGTTMKFVTGRTTYLLVRPMANPLAAGGRDRAAPPVAAAPVKGDVIRLARFEMKDPMCGGMVAGSRLAPVGWQMEGSVIWRANPFSAVTSAARFFNPRGVEQIAYYPSQLFYDGVRESVYKTAIINGPQMANAAAANWPEGSNYSGFEVRRRMKDPVVALREIMLQRFRKDLADAKPVSVVELKEVEQAQQAATGVQGCEVTVIRARFEYFVGKEPVEEDFYLTCTSYPILAPIQFWALELKSFRAAKGALDGATNLYHTMDASGEVNLKWYACVVDIQNRMQAAGYEAIAAAGRLSKYISARNEEVSQMIRQSYENTQRSNDKMAFAYSQSLRGVQRYDDPTGHGKSYDLPNSYGHAYINPSGEIILSNDPNFNPGAELHEDWREMKKSRQ